MWWERLKRVLVVRLDNIGDLVMLGPALRSLRNALPESHITALITKAGAKVVPLLPWVDDHIVYRPIWQEISPSVAFDATGDGQLAEDLRAREFDAAFIFTSFSQSPYPPAFVCYLAGIPVRVGQSKEFGGRVLTEWVKAPPDEMHQVDRNLFLLQSAGVPVDGHRLELCIPESDQRAADALLREAGMNPFAPFVVVAPGASCPSRRYDAARFARVASLLRQKSGLPLVVVGSEGEAELAAGIGPSLAGRCSVPVMSAVLRRAALLIGNNSAQMHIADAVGAPMVILFSGTDLHEQWRPRGAPARLLTRPTACAPCRGLRCAYNMECLDIPAEEVVEEAMGLLGDVRG